MIGYVDITRTQTELARLFGETFSNLLSISQGIISNIQKQFCELGYGR